MDILFGRIDLKNRFEKKNICFGYHFKGSDIWSNHRARKMTLRWLRNVFEFQWLFVSGEKRIHNHHSMFKFRAINLNLLSFYSVPMICGRLLNRICGQWIARVFDNFYYPFNHQLTTKNNMDNEQLMLVDL